MRIAICDNQVPFTRGGAERLRDALRIALLDRGHEVEIVGVPFRWHPPAQIPRHMMAWRLVDPVIAGADLAIAFRFPAYLARHPRKVVWLMHQHRTAYELWETDFGDLHQWSEGADVRAAIIAADSRAFAESPRVFAMSRTIASRLADACGVAAPVVRAPHPDPRRFRCNRFGDAVFYASRMDPLKRHRLLLESLVRTRSPVRCRLAGSGPERELLESAARNLGIERRVDFLGEISDAAVADEYANALAVFYGPYQEDYGYGPLEAFHSSKPVITCDDSGGPLELVTDGEGGYVVAPEPQALATAIDRLFDDRPSAERMGRSGRARLDALGLSWDRAVEELLA